MPSLTLAPCIRQIDDEAPPTGLAGLWNDAKRADFQVA